MQKFAFRKARLLALLGALFTVAACGGGNGNSDGDADADLAADADSIIDSGDDADALADADDNDGDVEDACPGFGGAATANWQRELISTELTVDVATQTATAIVELGESSEAGATLEVGDLTILDVRDACDRPLTHERDGEALHLGLRAHDAPLTVTIEYEYEDHDDFDGASEGGFTLTWPYYCGNLFPCHSDPADGLEFELTLEGIDEDLVAVYPETILTDAPSYMLAWAIGDYQTLEVGTTLGGVSLTAWHRPSEGTAAAQGTELLLESFEWMEERLGSYPFGDRAGTISIPWGFGAFGGMEHHPLWHVSSHSFADQEVQVHEAAHGWFGNGIRIRCWEDFVLSEGTVSYLTAQVLAEVGGEEIGQAVWEEYQRRLNRATSTTTTPQIAWPDSCGGVDILQDGLFSDIPYMKGAFFFLALERRVGFEELINALSLFFDENRGEAATMDDLLDTIAEQTGYDPSDCADAWLRSETVPEFDACP